VRRRISKSDSMTYRTGYRGGAALFSLPFLGVGVYFALVGFEFVPPPPGRINAPLWVIGFVGLAFALAGLMLLGHGLRGMRHHARRQRLIEFHPGRPWMADFDWDESGIESRLGARATQSVFGALLFCVFLAPFHWWAWISDHGSLGIWFVTGVFELIAIFVVGTALRHVAQWLKYGNMRLRFFRFPYEPGGPLEVVFAPNRFERFTATLRFVEERIEESGTGENRRSRIVHEALYEKAQEYAPGALQAEVTITFDLPDDDEWVNDISGTPVRYWELLLEADVPGVDLEASWPLPVYLGSRKATAPSGGSVMTTD
jgi:hypothetical protein